ncbi:hypothetical protein [Photobacterium carnosum]|nr:hypothetical protein [Photobacterium carnosum]
MRNGNYGKVIRRNEWDFSWYISTLSKASSGTLSSVRNSSHDKR